MQVVLCGMVYGVMWSYRSHNRGCDACVSSVLQNDGVEGSFVLLALEKYLEQLRNTILELKSVIVQD
jgi:hypothetical protein